MAETPPSARKWAPLSKVLESLNYVEGEGIANEATTLFELANLNVDENSAKKSNAHNSNNATSPTFCTENNVKELLTKQKATSEIAADSNPPPKKAPNDRSSYSDSFDDFDKSGQEDESENSDDKTHARTRSTPKGNTKEKKMRQQQPLCRYSS
jgi:hypothetical protein